MHKQRHGRFKDQTFTMATFIFLHFLAVSHSVMDFPTDPFVFSPAAAATHQNHCGFGHGNRSFDHMLGWMKKAINPAINGVTGKECCPVSTKNADPKSICFSDDAEFVDPDPGHSFEAVEQQSKHYQCPQNLSETVMKGFRPESVPVYAALVREFAVFDRWFSSIPGQHNPIGLFVYSATSHGSTSHVKKQLASGLRKDARKGKLPSLTVIEPAYFDLKGMPANDDHPSHDVANGQKLIKEVYETLRASPQWNETLLVITYDEHDGNSGPAPYFFKFDRLGVRVPTIMVSPWIKKGTVMSGPQGPTPNSEFEHSSIPATIKKMFNLSSNFLTHRDAWAGTFEQVVGQLTSPRTDCPETLPDVVPLRSTEAKEDAGLSEFQGEVVQLAGVLNGDHFLSSFPDEMSKKMSVKQAHGYVKGAVSRFIRASKEAIKLGADQSAIVDMRSSLTTRSSVKN
ncbi:non-specific phospholipase C6 [Prunus dulcis]|uniref:Non-specific phospholipase C6 n=1 Tax=Prunus dulcis TaxID=3755 RepID=A0A4Y1RHB0_PRUDU|nr:non-specific phospholipase C6 [Prunus dulcis]